MVLLLEVSEPLFSAEPVLVELRLPDGFDPFSAKSTGQYEEAASKACAAARQLRNLGGYRWRLPAIARELRQRLGESAGKQVYVGFLKTKYGYQIAALNQAYGMDAQSFTELLDSSITVDERRSAVERDDGEFEREIRTEMLHAIVAALRKCDPEHAQGGIRHWLQQLY